MKKYIHNSGIDVKGLSLFAIKCSLATFFLYYVGVVAVGAYYSLNNMLMSSMP